MDSHRFLQRYIITCGHLSYQRHLRAIFHIPAHPHDVSARFPRLNPSTGTSSRAWP